MRLRTYNSRRKRLYCGKKEPTGKPFCYVVYGPNSGDWYECGCGCKKVYYRGRLIDRERLPNEYRFFTNYGEAIAHLTRVKLAIDEEDILWADYTPCKIVEGCYTKSGKEIITKEVRLNNECDRPPERDFSVRLPRQRIGPSISVPKIVGNPYQRWATGGGQYTNPYVEADYMRSRGTTTSCSTVSGVDFTRDELEQLSPWYWRAAAGTN